ncbi:hypothetical protein M885DRAFT_579787 [Pelagophyceae sp. CCMP2097]|nr:hypothetical protein M885DRAFT_579787 [Pelagophyceae sp. CCMP2097]
MRTRCQPARGDPEDARNLGLTALVPRRSPTLRRALAFIALGAALGGKGYGTWLGYLAWFVVGFAATCAGVCSCLDVVRAPLRVPQSEPWSVVAAAVVGRSYEGIALFLGWPLPLLERAEYLERLCRLTVLDWTRRRHRRDFEAFLKRGRLTAAEAVSLLTDAAQKAPEAMHDDGPTHDDDDDDLYQYVNDDDVLRGVLPGSLAEAEAFLALDEAQPAGPT